MKEAMDNMISNDSPYIDPNGNIIIPYRICSAPGISLCDQPGAILYGFDFKWALLPFLSFLLANILLEEKRPLLRVFWNTLNTFLRTIQQYNLGWP